MPKPKQPTAPVAVYLRISSKDPEDGQPAQSILEWPARSGYDLGQVGWYPDKYQAGR
jgi:hypothetical protein